MDLKLTNKKYARHHFNAIGNHIGATTWFEGMKPKRIVGERECRDCKSTAKVDSFGNELFENDLIKVSVEGVLKSMQMITMQNGEFLLYPSSKMLAKVKWDMFIITLLPKFVLELPLVTAAELVENREIELPRVEVVRLGNMWEVSKL